MQKNFWTKVTTSKISKDEAKKLYKEFIQKDIDELEREKSNSIKKNNILEILKNIDAIFTGPYLHQRELPKKTMLEKNIAESVKLKERRIAEIKKKKHKQ